MSRTCNGDDGRKLSKRHGAVSVDEFRNAGYVAPALMNFLALLGWAPDGETTIMSRDELIERFSLDRVGSSPATFDYAQARLDERRLPAGDEPGGVRRRARRVPARAGDRVARGAHQGGGAARAGEDLAPGRVPRLRAASCSRTWSRTRRCSTAAGRCSRPPRRRSRRWSRSTRSGSRRPCGLSPTAWAQAAPGLGADTRRRDGLEGLSGSVGEPRAPGSRRVAAADPARGCGVGLGRASGSSARWNCRHARRRNCGVGPGRRRASRCMSAVSASGCGLAVYHF